MPTTSWNDEEHEALMGLPHECRSLYFMVFRRWMDYPTGITGLSRKLCRAQLHECLEVVNGQGSHKGAVITYTWRQIRRAIDKLIYVGLLTRLPGYQHTMVYFLPLADYDQKTALGRPPMSATMAAPNVSSMEPDKEGYEDISIEKTAPRSALPEAEKMAPLPVSGINNTHSMPGRRVELRSTISRDWQPSQNTIEQARMHGLPDATDDNRILKFRSHYLGKGELAGDWDQMYIKWLTNDRIFEQERQHRRANKGNCNGTHKQGGRRSASAILADGISDAFD